MFAINIPLFIYQDNNLDKNEMLLYSLICTEPFYANRNVFINYSDPFLCSVLNFSPEKLNHIFDSLIQKKYLRKHSEDEKLLTFVK